MTKDNLGYRGLHHWVVRMKGNPIIKKIKNV